MICAVVAGSIINERRGQANFQLIIITHDESFLRKLGQAEVMDYYWYAIHRNVGTVAYLVLFNRRVSRDGRQKSMIERQRFG